MLRSDLPCGCRRCGCLCEAHSVTDGDRLCARHLALALARAAARELLAIVALSLFVGCVAVWAIILA